MTTPTAPRASEAVARPVRGLGQGGLGYLVVDCISEFGNVNFTERQYGLATLVAGLVISFIQNLLENKHIIPAVLRQVPPTTAPVVDQPDNDIDYTDTSDKEPGIPAEEFPDAEEFEDGDSEDEGAPTTATVVEH